MDYLQSLRMFVKVAELGSFTGAADQLKVSSAVATRSVASLEERLDARLLQRTTRSVTLTEAGRLFLDRVRTIVDDIDDVEGGLLAATGVPSGTLRIAVQGSVGAGYLAKLLSAYTERHPRVVPQVIFADGPISLVEGRFDAALTNDTYPHAGSVVVRAFAHLKMTLVASPRYTPGIHRIANLTDIDPLVMLTLDDGTTGTEHDPVRRWLDTHTAHATRIHANNSDMLRRMAIEGMGVALVPAVLVEDDLDDGSLVPVSSETALPSMGLSVAYGSRRNLAPNVRALVDLLVEQAGYERLPVPLRHDDAALVSGN
ncbi:LysR family transcriptional regulator [Paraburkholderia phymatum]|uniref:Transcriptional regulator, LysR family n=1 Tax=Paraburkholderia phymatum (strain DSM 17167 / CIP 108236 / LMG 21445 / STM815) TaxID=391038 RepID=B2JUN7_PARP8|nr:LysR family transcriptional regulator [Paraburkholderia phymatum]ACC76208.1 transcriptional regulator, LysR family [Paraburkholderia phymatum STM815]